MWITVNSIDMTLKLRLYIQTKSSDEFENSVFVDKTVHRPHYCFRNVVHFE